MDSFCTARTFRSWVYLSRAAVIPVTCKFLYSMPSFPVSFGNLFQNSLNCIHSCCIISSSQQKSGSVLLSINLSPSSSSFNVSGFFQLRLNNPLSWWISDGMEKFMKWKKKSARASFCIVLNETLRFCAEKCVSSATCPGFSPALCCQELELLRVGGGDGGKTAPQKPLPDKSPGSARGPAERPGPSAITNPCGLISLCTS